MNDTAELTVTTEELAVPGARLYYEVRGQGPAVLLLGSPMDADAFAPLAELLAGDHTVVTMDPRAIHRSTVDDRDQDSTPPMRADDVAQLLDHLDLGPAAAFGSSGGAVTVLALAQARPDLVHTVVAHEPPLDELLEDRAERRAVAEAIVNAYLTEGRAAAWRLFLADANIAWRSRCSPRSSVVPSRATRPPTRTSSSGTRCDPPSSSCPTSTPCALAGPGSWSASASIPPGRSATVRRGRWLAVWASSRSSSPATTPGSPRTPRASPRPSARTSPDRLTALPPLAKPAERERPVRTGATRTAWWW